MRFYRFYLIKQFSLIIVFAFAHNLHLRATKQFSTKDQRLIRSLCHRRTTLLLKLRNTHSHTPPHTESACLLHTVAAC